MINLCGKDKQKDGTIGKANIGAGDAAKIGAKMAVLRLRKYGMSRESLSHGSEANCCI